LGKEKQIGGGRLSILSVSKSQHLKDTLTLSLTFYGLFLHLETDDRSHNFRRKARKITKSIPFFNEKDARNNAPGPAEW